ncbi:hypothetical protein FSP39_017278 [Pinctada imbricata]|uniref:Uncharacterized protein n=1 Tax=Pinctada imbricata TaxID=66713 RepID=A0AA88YEC1_PINIB|nr:hypothetical protein FSP39_017278 [Pinctada imbricata]
MVMAALIYLDKELVTGMSVGSTVDYGIAADVLIFVAGLSYTPGVVLLFMEMKKAAKVTQESDGKDDTAGKTTEMKVTVTPPEEESAKDKKAKI